MDCGVRDQHHLRSAGNDAKPHVPGVVARRCERRNVGSDLDVAVDGLEAVHERRDATLDVRPLPLRPHEGEAVSMHDVAGPREEDRAGVVRVPPNMVDVEMREEDDVDLVAADTVLLERSWQPTLRLRSPVPQTGRADAGVDQHGLFAGADQEARARHAPARPGEEGRVERSIGLPFVRGGLGIQLGELAELPDGVEQRDELDRADYDCTRGGAGSPCASSHEITGLRRTPIRSISASITSPGFR